jgi:pyruvate dehydrogenase E2 component (dihydrolipoamide acetyltransferase)
MADTALRPSRRAASPYARKLARERGIALDMLRGSGPSGRVVAADVTGLVPVAEARRRSTGRQASALGATVALGTLQRLLADFTEAGTPFGLEDVVLRAAGCALDDVPGATRLEGAPVALETVPQVVFADIRKSSLAPLRARRLAARAAGEDQSQMPAALSLRPLRASGVRPVMMPLLGGCPMRLVLAIGDNAAEALLVFDAATVDEDTAGEFLVRFKGYLEVPLRLLV